MLRDSKLANYIENCKLFLKVLLNFL